jgi:IclR family KDG regulon transcriptional repressor
MDVTWIEDAVKRPSVDSHVPVYSTALGKSILVFLPEEEAERILRATLLKKWTDKPITSIRGIVADCKKAREIGYAIDDPETEMGARCVGAPLFNSQGPIAAISISSP